MWYLTDVNGHVIGQEHTLKELVGEVDNLHSQVRLEKGIYLIVIDSEDGDYKVNYALHRDRVGGYLHEKQP